MKNIYRVERMTIDNYNRYMSGSNFYDLEVLKIEAENKEEAIEKAKAEGYVVNKDYVKTIEEIEAKEKAIEEAYEKRLAKEKARNEKARLKRLEKKLGKK